MMRSVVRSIPLLALTVALLALGASATAAPAAPPTPYDQTFTFAAGEACSFPTEVHIVGKAGFNPVPNNPVFPGGIAPAPAQQATVTNLDTGESVTVTVTGVFKFIPQPDGSLTIVASGQNLLFGEPQVGVGVLATTGPIEVVAVNGEIAAPPDLSGAQVRDLCQELA